METRRRTRKIFVGGLILFLALGALSIFFRPTVAVGFFAPFSGPQAGLAGDLLKGMNLAVTDWKSWTYGPKPMMQIHSVDTEGKSSKIADAIRTLVDSDQVRILIGDFAADQADVAGRELEKLAVPVLIPKQDHGSGVKATGLSIFPSLDQEADMLAHFALHSLKLEKTGDVIVIHHKGVEEEVLAKKSLELLGGVGRSYEIGERPYPDKIAADVIEQSPNTLIILLSSMVTSRIVQTLRSNNFTGNIVVRQRLDDSFLRSTGEPAILGTYVQTIFEPLTDSAAIEFSEAYANLYSANPSPAAALGFELIRLTQQSLSVLPWSNSPRNLRVRLAKKVQNYICEGEFSLKIARIEKEQSPVVLRSSQLPACIGR